MEIQPDFRELLALFNENHVEYMIVGGYALAFYGVPRSTGDLDIWICPNAENAQCILAALSQFGFGSVGLSSTDFETPNQVIQLGFPPVRIDIITSLTGVSWEDAYADRIPGFYESVPVFYIGRNQFIVNKRALGRHKDLADVETLGED